MALDCVNALVFQQKLGVERRRQRLRYLGDYRQSRLRVQSGVRVHALSDFARSFGVASMMIDGVPSAALTRHLRRKASIAVQDTAGAHSPFANAIRISPAPYTTLAELDRFVAAVSAVAARGLPASE